LGVAARDPARRPLLLLLLLSGGTLHFPAPPIHIDVARHTRTLIASQCAVPQRANNKEERSSCDNNNGRREKNIYILSQPTILKMMNFTATPSSPALTPHTPSTTRTRAERRKSLFKSPLKAREEDPNQLASKGKDPGAYFGKFLIMLVLEENIDDLVCFLAEKGADPNYVDPDDFTPLYVAVKHGLNDCAKVLVNHGAQITKSTKTWPSPMRLAMQTNNQELIQFFEARLAEAETQWSMAKRESARSASEEPSRKRRRVEVENGQAEDERQHSKTKK